MSVLNRHHFYFIDAPDYKSEDAYKELRTEAAIFLYRNFDDADYYYLEIKNGEAFEKFSLTELIGPQGVYDVRNGIAYLCVNNSHEAFHHVVKPIYEHLVIKESIPVGRIILLTESADILTEVRKQAAEFRTIPFKCEWIRQFEWNCQLAKKLMAERNEPSPLTLEFKGYPKTYLNFNRRWRLHRVALVALLKAKNLLDVGYVSMGQSDTPGTWNSSLWEYVKFLSFDNDELFQLYMANDEAIMALPNMYLDTEDLVTNRADLTAETNYLYENSLVSVVTETNYYTKLRSYESSRFLSEKTFKPIAQKHPFIITSVPNMLPKLRELGYQTFHPWINEAYDSEPDDHKRLLMIAREIERLHYLSDFELHEYVTNCKEICEHNYSTLMTKTEFITRLN